METRTFQYAILCAGCGKTFRDRPPASGWERIELAVGRALLLCGGCLTKIRQVSTSTPSPVT